jgi:hypothetical protein
MRTFVVNVCRWNFLTGNIYMKLSELIKEFGSLIYIYIYVYIYIYINIYIYKSN